MTCKDICNKLPDQEMMDIQMLLTESAVIGCVKRLGKTADGSPKEDMYYYKAELDSNLERRKRYSDVGKSARKCTMKDTQYFFRVKYIYIFFINRPLNIIIYLARFHLNLQPIK